MNRKFRIFIVLQIVLYVCSFLLGAGTVFLFSLTTASMLIMTAGQKADMQMLRELGTGDWIVFVYSLREFLPCFAMLGLLLLKIPIAVSFKIIIIMLYMLFAMSIVCESASSREVIHPLLWVCQAVFVWLGLTDIRYTVPVLAECILIDLVLLDEDVVFLRETGITFMKAVQIAGVANIHRDWKSVLCSLGILVILMLNSVKFA